VRGNAFPLRLLVVGGADLNFTISPSPSRPTHSGGADDGFCAARDSLTFPLARWINGSLVHRFFPFFPLRNGLSLFGSFDFFAIAISLLTPSYTKNLPTGGSNLAASD